MYKRIFRPGYPMTVACLLFYVAAYPQQRIDRKALVERHKVINQSADPLSSLTVGNGKFAFTVDITGLQSFPEAYAKGIPLGTESEWGWHRFPDTAGYQFAETLKDYPVNGREISYSVQHSATARQKGAIDYFRVNPHRLQLGNLGLELLRKDGRPAALSDLKDIRQELNPWTGEIHSRFTLGGTPVELITFCHQDRDVVAVQIRSALLETGRLRVRLRFPYPTGAWADAGDNWKDTASHLSRLVAQGPHRAFFLHRLDSTRYHIDLRWEGNGIVEKRKAHDFILVPGKGQSVFAVDCEFAPPGKETAIPSFAETRANSLLRWKAFWMRGGAVDFSGSTDPRAFELERRVILSQYLTKIQCAGSYPPQETGLTYNSWYGKPHLEMHWWHGVHFALWGRIDLLQKSLGWYARVAGKARGIAQRQGFDGIRWQKMTDPAGDESPSSVGAFLIWQQPHFIYYAELCYRQQPGKTTLDRYKDLVFATADFMASYPFYDGQNNRYILGKGMIPAQECFHPETTFNPCFELAYWYWALRTAQEWRLRCGLPRKARWDAVLQKLSALPQAGGVYLATESTPDCYTDPTYLNDHPAVLATFGVLPGSPRLDTAVMRHTFDLVWKKWHWQKTWGWDFPMTAMTATRLGMPGKAIDALFMDVPTNTYLKNGHNYQDGRLRLYLPGNGGLLTAIAMMCAGYDGCREKEPGIPKNGKWKVRWEGLQRMP